MATRIDALSADEKEAVTDYVRGEYDKLVFQHPTDYVTRNVRAEPEGWQRAMCELIASDCEMVKELTRAAQRQLSKSSNGFTLIELSIVLVIIGLVVGGIMVGQSLIGAASARAQITQLETYQSAFNTFLVKYNCLPGDCSNATNFFGTTDSLGNAIVNGNGNGMIDTANGTFYDDGNSTWAASTEMSGAFQELAAAKLVPFVPSSPTSQYLPSSSSNFSHPNLQLNTSAGFFFGASYNYTVDGPLSRNPLVDQYQTGTNAIWMVDCNSQAMQLLQGWDDGCAIFKASDLLAMDQKIDDGQPLGGHLMGFGGYGSNNDCLNINGVTSTYKTTNATPQCQAVYVIN